MTLISRSLQALRIRMLRMITSTEPKIGVKKQPFLAKVYGFVLPFPKLILAGLQIHCSAAFLGGVVAAAVGGCENLQSARRMRHCSCCTNNRLLRGRWQPQRAAPRVMHATGGSRAAEAAASSESRGDGRSSSSGGGGSSSSSSSSGGSSSSSSKGVGQASSEGAGCTLQ